MEASTIALSYCSFGYLVRNARLAAFGDFIAEIRKV